MPGNRQIFDLAIKRGNAFARQQAWNEAAAEYQRALAEFPDDPKVLTVTASTLIRAQRLADALTTLQHASQVQPGDLKILEGIADVQGRIGKLSDAAQTYVAIGDLHNRQGNPHQAIETWIRASQLDSDNIAAHQSLAAAYQAQDKLKLAVGEMLTLVKIYRKNGQIDQAAQQCQAALALDPRNTDALKTMDAIRVKRSTGPLPTLPEHSPAAPGLGAPAAVSSPIWSEPGIVAAEADVRHLDGPVDLTAQQALSDLAESIFEETPIAQPRPDARGAAARLSKAEIDALIGQAIDFQTSGQAQQAIAVYRRILEALELPAVRFSLGVLYEQELDFGQAIEQFQRSVKYTEYTLGSHFALGECYRARGRNDEALKHIVEALKLVDLGTVKPEQADDLAALYANLADSYLQGDPDRATQFTNSLVEFLSSKGWQDKVVEARQRLDNLTDQGASPISLAELFMVPNAEAVLQSLTLTQEYAKLGKAYAAIEEAYTAFAYAPDYLPMHWQIADVLWNSGYQEAATAKYRVIADTYRARGNDRQAMTIYQRILHLTPMDEDIRSKLIELHTRRGETDSALEQYMALADTYYQLAQIDKARQVYEEARSYATRASDSQHWAQQILHKIGDIDVQRIDWRRAIQDYEQIKSIAPNDEKARLSLVELYFKTGDNARSIKELDDLLVSYATSGKTRKIIPTLEDQMRNHPQEMGLRARLARAYLGAGMTAQGIEQLDTLGDLQLQAGLQKEAAATIRAILALNPPNAAEYRQVLAQISATGSL